MTHFERRGVGAAAANHRSWQATLARTVQGTVEPLGRGELAYLPTGGGDASVLYPVLQAEDGDEVGPFVDAVLARLRALGDVHEAGWWESGCDDQLGGRLLARGFQWGWRPRWMARDLALPVGEFPLPPEVTIDEVRQDVRWGVADLPYHDPPWEQRFGALVRQRPGETVILAASQQGRVVGKVVVHLQPDGQVAGLYECGVVERARRRGIGAALTAEAVRWARDRGASLAVLNATPMGEPVYARAGFVACGWGQTWWLVDGRAAGGAPPPGLVRLGDAIADGDPWRIHAALGAAGVDVNADLPCGWTPLRVAVQLHRQEAAAQLEREGARVGLLAAWDLGWRDRAADMVRRRPSLVSRRRRGGATLLHRAVERDDEDLLRLLLTAAPDLTVRDLEFDSTPLGWAEHLGRRRLAEILREAGAGTSATPRPPVS